MSLEEERIHAWFSLARTILSETGWEARKSGDLRSMVSHNYGNPMDLGKRAIEMMGFAWLSMVFHIILVSISWCSKARQQLLQRGCRVHWVHFRIAHGRWVDI